MSPFARLNAATVRVLQAHGCEVGDSRRATCLWSAACSRRHSRTSPGAWRARISMRFGRRLRRHHHQCGWLRLHSEKNTANCCRTIRTTPRARCSSLPDPRCHGVSGLDRADSRNEARERDGHYQDSAISLTARKFRSAPRQLLRAVPGLEFRECPWPDACCGSAGIYNAMHTICRCAFSKRR